VTTGDSLSTDVIDLCAWFEDRVEAGTAATIDVTVR
jgi:hypothetical protein